MVRLRFLRKFFIRAALSLASFVTLTLIIQNLPMTYLSREPGTMNSEPPEEIAFENPPMSFNKPSCLSENRFYVRNPSEKNRHYLTVHSYGGLGNQLFQYASLIGIAKHNFMIPVLSNSSILRNIFNISTRMCDESWVLDWPSFEDEKPCTYDKASEELNYEIHIALLGFFQSWKYFYEREEVIKNEFTFKNDIVMMANKFIQDSFKQLGKKKMKTIGIHIRRGDMLDYYNVEKGYTVADKNYLGRAIEYYTRDNWLDMVDNLLFVVCSDDIYWAKSNLNTFHGVNFVYSESGNDVIDLAILSSCDHSIITVGTYGWWAGWMAGGSVVYYRNYPQEYSPLSDVFEPKDYFPETWIGL